MIRLRVSTLEAFRRVVGTPYGEEAELLERIERGQWAEGPSNWKMDAGTAWHAALEDPDGQEYRREYHGDTCAAYCHVGDYSFKEQHVRAALRHIGPGVCELTGRKVFDLGGRKVEVEGTADHVRGLVIQDHKATFDTPDPRNYEQSLQWRFYLAIHQAAVFRYNLFAFSQPKNGYCDLRDIVSFRMWPYAGMQAELADWLYRFLAWSDQRGLTPLLEDQPAEVAS